MRLGGGAFSGTLSDEPPEGLLDGPPEELLAGLSGESLAGTSEALLLAAVHEGVGGVVASRSSGGIGTNVGMSVNGVPPVASGAEEVNPEP